MTASDADRDPLEALATEFVEKCRAGAAPTIEQYAREHPHLADEIRELFPTILAVELAKGSRTSSGSGIYNMPTIERLGDFRIIRELGRGGMGVVYEAKQESLDRHVAIKVLPREFTNDPRRKERFEREARTAARLHHTNIVPIFGVGEHEGCPYFVMQYIRGVGLDRLFQSLTREPGGAGPSNSSDPLNGSGSLIRHVREIVRGREHPDRAKPLAGQPEEHTPSAASGEQLPTGGEIPPELASSRRGGYWASLASLIAQAADALHFAHSQGVLHRDIKPSNLIVDADGTLWVTDFGLAKAIEHDDLTEAGDVIGTLRYLAPEQFSGASDGRSDVYSLGVTAFELATLTPTYAGTGRSTLIREIMDGPPLRPRERCPAIPLDFETILLKATARAPSDRYESAAALRDDLRRFVDDLPIQARRATYGERARRWARRNPQLAAATFLVFALLVLTAGVSSAAFFRVRAARERVQQALLGETRQRERAEATAELAVDAFDTVLDELAPSELHAAREFSLEGTDENTVPVAVPNVVTPETANLLGHLLQFYERLADQQDESEQLQLKAAAANRRVGEIYELLGRYAESDAAYSRAIDIFERARRDGDPSGELAIALSQTRNQLGGLLASQDTMFEAQMEFDAAADLLEPLVAAPDPPAEAKFELARTYYLSARRSSVRLPPDPGQPGGPVPRLDRPPPPQPPPPRDRPALGRDRPGPAGRDRPLPGGPRRGLRPPPLPIGPELQAGRRREHAVELDQAVELLRDLSSKEIRDPKYEHLLALCLREREAMRAGPARAPDVAESVKLLETLVERYPAVSRYRLDLAETLATQDRAPQGLEQLSRALTILQALVDERPNVPTYRFALGHGHLRLSHVYEEKGDADAALREARLALSIHAGLAGEHGNTTAFVVTAALCESVVARLLEQQRDLEGAKNLLVSATDRLKLIGVADDPRPHIRAFAGRCFDQLSRVYHDLGEHEDARAALEMGRSFGPEGPFRPE